MDVYNDVAKVLGLQPMPEIKIKDSIKIIYNVYEKLKVVNQHQTAVHFHINFKSKENFLWIEINEQYFTAFMELYYSYIKELVSPLVAIVKATQKFIQKANDLDTKFKVQG